MQNFTVDLLEFLILLWCESRHFHIWNFFDSYFCNKNLMITFFSLLQVVITFLNHDAYFTLMDIYHCNIYFRKIQQKCGIEDIKKPRLMVEQSL